MSTTLVHANYCMAFALASRKAEVYSVWILDSLRDLAHIERNPDSQVIISDSCCAFENTVAKVHTHCQQRLCIWHINKKVLYYTQKK